MNRSLAGLVLPVLLFAACEGKVVSGPPAPGGHGGAGEVPPPDESPPGQPAGWDSALRLREARDLNPDPRVVEIDLEARVAPLEIVAGTTTQAWTYDGGIPGPLIRVRRGDRLIVHFTNRLPRETTIHWHGLRIPVAMDGVPEHSQPPVQPGQSFDYDFVVPDAGLFWYHPHFDSSAQLGDGLYGALLVEDDTEPRGFGDELVVVLSDIDIEPDGSLGPHDSGGDVGTLFGREGNILLVNGRVKPVLRARAGMPQRWRVVNSAKSRYYQLALEGHTFLRIGGDGGLLSAPIEVERPVLTPGERADLVLVPKGAAGTELPLRWVPYDRGFGSTFRRPEEVIATVRFEGRAVKPPPLPATGRRIEALATAGATPIEVKFTQDKVNGKFALGINGVPGQTTFHAYVGETQIWTLINTIEFAHPFHLHGFFFQVLDGDGHALPAPEWKDTVDVPVKGVVKVAVRYDDRPGTWMFHCHILDHADAGMMGMLDLEAP
jgi:FtsP/CotA-like multicopper oxidase with cupredoxin domain